MCGRVVDIQSETAEIRRGIKKDRKIKPQDKNIMSASATQGGHKKLTITTSMAYKIRATVLAVSNITKSFQSLDSI